MAESTATVSGRFVSISNVYNVYYCQ